MSRKHWLRNLLIVLESKSKSYYWTLHFSNINTLNLLKCFFTKEKYMKKSARYSLNVL